jgi:hypothetical protein
LPTSTLPTSTCQLIIIRQRGLSLAFLLRQLTGIFPPKPLSIVAATMRPITVESVKLQHPCIQSHLLCGITTYITCGMYWTITPWRMQLLVVHPPQIKGISSSVDETPAAYKWLQVHTRHAQYVRSDVDNTPQSC